MAKKLFYMGAVLIGTSILFSSTFGSDGGESCEYTGKLEQCLEANKNGTARSIKDFVCQQSNDTQAIFYNIVLDVEFREIDEEAMEYLVALDEDVEFAATQTNRAIDDTTKNFGQLGVYYKKYKELCNGGILAKMESCGKSIPNILAGKSIKGSDLNRECMALVENKLDIYLKVADNTLKLNKSEYLQDGHKKYLQQEREKYDALLNDMINIIGHMGRLARGLEHYTGTPLQAMFLKKIYSYISHTV